jgi:FtsP/CotA-like multicopper oxidase with cupredoxin domain
MLIAGAAGAAASLTGALGIKAEAQSPQYQPSPNAPRNQNVPAGMDGPEIIHPDKDAPNNINQMQIVGLVHRLYKLSVELQDEVDHTDIRATFPLSVVKKAQQIEKLAKQIKDQAKG